MLIFQGPVPVLYKDQGYRISGFPAVLGSNDCRSNDGAMIIKQYNCVLKPWLQKINVSANYERKALIIIDLFSLHLNNDLLKDNRIVSYR